MKKLILIVMFCTVSGLALAQSGDPMAIDNRVETLSKEITKLRQDFLALKRTPVLLTEEQASSYIDTFAMRLQDIEAQAQALTGQVEETEFKNRQMNEKLQKMQADYDLRFTQLEKKTAELEEKAKKAPEVKKTEAKKEEPKKAEPTAKTNAPVKPAVDAPKPAAPKKELTELEFYDVAFALVRDRKHGEAIKKFEEFTQKFPKSNLNGNAYYWIGECYAADGKYDRAAVAYGEGYQKFKNSPKAQDNLFKLGTAFKRMKKNEEACMAFFSFEYEFPNASAETKQKIAKELEELKCQ